MVAYPHPRRFHRTEAGPMPHAFALTLSSSIIPDLIRTFLDGRSPLNDIINDGNHVRVGTSEIVKSLRNAFGAPVSNV